MLILVSISITNLKKTNVFFKFIIYKTFIFTIYQYFFIFPNVLHSFYLRGEVTMQSMCAHSVYSYHDDDDFDDDGERRDQMLEQILDK